MVGAVFWKMPPRSVSLDLSKGVVMQVVRVVLATVGTGLSLLLLGVPILFGLWCGVIGPARGRPFLMAYNLGLWFGPLYLLFLLFQRNDRLQPSLPPPSGPPHQV